MRWEGSGKASVEPLRHFVPPPLGRGGIAPCNDIITINNYVFGNNNTNSGILYRFMLLCNQEAIMIRIRLSTLLGERRMSQITLARKTGIRPATINEMYNEFSVRVNLEHIDKICEVLDCDISELLVYEPNSIKTTPKC